MLKSKSTTNIQTKTDSSYRQYETLCTSILMEQKGNCKIIETRALQATFHNVISKSIPHNLDYFERKQILPKNDTQKSGNSPKSYPKIQEQPPKSTQNNGTSPYHDIFKLPPSPGVKCNLMKLLSMKM